VQPEQRFLVDGKVSLGDLLMAKLREQQGGGDK
jgi:hypothetical protein